MRIYSRTKLQISVHQVQMSFLLYEGDDQVQIRTKSHEELADLASF